MVLRLIITHVLIVFLLVEKKGINKFINIGFTVNYCFMECESEYERITVYEQESQTKIVKI